MDIYLLRHGIAEEGSAYPEDSERPLTEEGRKKVRKAAVALRRSDLTFDAVYSSPYRRAVETAEIVCETMSFKGKTVISDALVPSADHRHFTKLLKDQDPNAACLFVGHMPNLSRVLSGLLRADFETDLRKGGMAYLHVDTDGRGTLGWVLTNRQLRALA